MSSESYLCSGEWATRWGAVATRWGAGVTQWGAEATQWGEGATRWGARSTRWVVETIGGGRQLGWERGPHGGSPGATRWGAGSNSFLVNWVLNNRESWEYNMTNVKISGVGSRESCNSLWINHGNEWMGVEHFGANPWGYVNEMWSRRNDSIMRRKNHGNWLLAANYYYYYWEGVIYTLSVRRPQPHNTNLSTERRERGK